MPQPARIGNWRNLICLFLMTQCTFHALKRADRMSNWKIQLFWFQLNAVYKILGSYVSLRRHGQQLPNLSCHGRKNWQGCIRPYRINSNAICRELKIKESRLFYVVQGGSGLMETGEKAGELIIKNDAGAPACARRPHSMRLFLRIRSPERVYGNTLSGRKRTSRDEQ